MTNIEELSGYVGRLQDMLSKPHPGLERWRTELDGLLLKVAEFAPAPVEYAEVVALTTDVIRYLLTAAPQEEVSRDYGRRLEESLSKLSRSRLPWGGLAEVGWSIAAMNHYRREGQRWLFVVLTKDFVRPGRTRLLSIRHEGPDDSQFWDKVTSKARMEELSAEHDDRRIRFFGMEKSFERE